MADHGLPPGPDPHDHGADQRRHRVEVLAEHRRDLLDQDIPQDAPADSGEYSHDASRVDRETEIEALHGPDHGEQGQPGGVEHEHHRAHPRERRVEPEDEQGGDERHERVAPVGEHQGLGVDEQVADGAAAEGADDADDDHAEQVEPLAHRGARPGGGEDRGADQFGDQAQRARVDIERRLHPCVIAGRAPSQ